MKILPIQTNANPTRRGHRALVTAALGLTLATGMISSPALAQDGTGAATPTPPTACQIIPATATYGAANAVTPAATSDATPVATTSASPVTDLTGTPPATAGIDTSATPVASATQVTTVDPVTQDLQASATAIAGCLSDANYETLALLTGDLYRGQLLGIGSELGVEDFTSLAATLPQVPYQILTVDEATMTSETTATAVVTYELAHQVRKSTWEFSLQDIQGTQAWVLESETAMAADLPASTTTVQVTIQDNAYSLDNTTISGPSIVLTATNNDAVDHELLVIRLDGDATTQTLLQSPGPSLPEGITFIGQVTVPAGSTGTLLLSGVQPGGYAIVDLLPNASGLPHLADGMEVAFTVE